MICFSGLAAGAQSSLRGETEIQEPAAVWKRMFYSGGENGMPPQLPVSALKTGGKKTELLLPKTFDTEEFKRADDAVPVSFAAHSVVLEEEGCSERSNVWGHFLLQEILYYFRC